MYTVYLYLYARACCHPSLMHLAQLQYVLKFRFAYVNGVFAINRPPRNILTLSLSFYLLANSKITTRVFYALIMAHPSSSSYTYYLSRELMYDLFVFAVFHTPHSLSLSLTLGELIVFVCFCVCQPTQQFS